MLGTPVIGAAIMTNPAIAASDTGAAQSDTDKAFEAIYSSEYAWRLTQYGPSEDGPKNDTPSLPDESKASQDRREARWRSVQQQLSAIDTAKLSDANKVNFEVYKQQIDALLEAQEYREYEKPLNSDTSFWGNMADWARSGFRTEKDARNFIAIMHDLPRYYDQQITNMRAGLKRGFTPPAITLQGRDIGVAQVVDAGASEESVFYSSFKNLPASIPAATQADLRKQALDTIRTSVVPAHQKLLTFLRKDYIPGARKPLDAYSLPDGKAYYRSKVREFVTLDKSPEEIHQIGLDEMAKIRAEMADVMKEVKFTGTLGEFLTFLRTDPQFYAKTPQELLNRAAWIAKTFDGKADEYFNRLPRRRFAIKPVPDDVAPFYTGGRGGPGIYLVNTYNLPARPLYSQVALTLHESAPGHAMQMPLAAENKDLPAFRRDMYLSAYGEGWALYCEKLGVEMGMYETPYDLFGMLSYQAWRASRLVVDTGIHAMGWSREQAIQYLHDNTALAQHEIQTEVDRYIAWPGQALSYYMGQLTIMNARARAEKALGEKFDVRSFHDAVLELGSVPLTVVDQRVDKLIADGGKGPYDGE
ncbi:MAG: DUF885 family protein [Sphingobium sp.]|nr:DUF885 family protein [Sphingobium sp.]